MGRVSRSRTAAGIVERQYNEKARRRIPESRDPTVYACPAIWKAAPCFEKAHKHLRKVALASGMSKRGAQAWATLKLVELKKIAEERLDPNSL